MPEPIARSGANFFGFEYIEGDKRRRNQKVIRGNGTLELYDDRLVFSRLVPGATYTVPLDRVTAVEIGRGHNGKIVWPWRVLKVAYRDGERTAIIGLLVGRRGAAEKWAEAVRRLAGLTP